LDMMVFHIMIKPYSQLPEPSQLFHVLAESKTLVPLSFPASRKQPKRIQGPECALSLSLGFTLARQTLY
jgi:hypothetical protein